MLYSQQLTKLGHPLVKECLPLPVDDQMARKMVGKMRIRLAVLISKIARFRVRSLANHKVLWCIAYYQYVSWKRKCTRIFCLTVIWHCWSNEPQKSNRPSQIQIHGSDQYWWIVLACGHWLCQEIKDHICSQVSDKLEAAQYCTADLQQAPQSATEGQRRPLSMRDSSFLGWEI